MLHTIEIEQHFQRGSGSNQSFEDFLDGVMNQLDTTGVEADYLANFNTLASIWTISVDAENQLDALAKASTALRSAVHAAQHSTNWEPQLTLVRGPAQNSNRGN